MKCEDELLFFVLLNLKIDKINNLKTPPGFWEIVMDIFHYLLTLYRLNNHEMNCQTNEY